MEPENGKREITNDEFVIKDNELILCNAAGDVVIPDGVTAIAKMALAKNTKIKTLTIPKSVNSFGANNVNPNNTKSIKAVYFKGTPEELAKIKDTFRSNVMALCENVYCLKNNKYEQIVGKKSIYFHTTGFDKNFLKFNEYSFISDIEDYLKNRKGQGFNTIICIENQNINFIFECRKDELEDKILDLLLNKRIDFACDDYLVDWNRDFFYYSVFMAKEYNLEIKDGVLVKCKDIDPNDKPEYTLHTAKCILPSGITKIDENAFSDYDAFMLSIPLTRKEFLKTYSRINLNGNPILPGIVWCNDGIICIRNINHVKADKGLYYSGCHFNNKAALSAIEAARLKQYFRFNKEAPRMLYFSSGKFALSETASIYQDDTSNVEYCVFDFENFNRIQVVDFEAG